MDFSDLRDGAHSLYPHAMTLDEVRGILSAQVLCCSDMLSIGIKFACGCDLMSDVLAFTQPGALLLTGLTNNQVVRTAEVLDLTAIVFCRDKQPDAETISLAEELKIPLLSSPHPLYESCGLLFKNGLNGCGGLRK
jgi:predicted transcriptional regulator